jgi:hypothetical protein
VIFVKVDLPDGNWIEMRDVDDLRTGDKLAVRRAMKIPRSQDGTTDVTAAFTDEMRIAMLGRIVTNWSYEGWPIPSLALSAESAIEQLPIEVYDKLCDEIKPHMDAIDYSPSE